MWAKSLPDSSMLLSFPLSFMVPHLLLSGFRLDALILFNGYHWTTLFVLVVSSVVSLAIFMYHTSSNGIICEVKQETTFQFFSTQIKLLPTDLIFFFLLIPSSNIAALLPNVDRSNAGNIRFKEKGRYCFPE